MYEYNVTNRKDYGSLYPNIWDLIAFSAVIILFMLLARSVHEMVMPEPVMDLEKVDLSIFALPGYALQSFIRMFVALFFSLMVTFLLGTLAARSSLAEAIIIPMIDILQSIPILGYLSLAAVVFVRYAPNQYMGFEIVALFAIFTSQVWNMILSFYQSLRTVPANLQEMSAVFQLSRLQKFWRVDVPHATPDLLLSMMVSLSQGWFYVVESETIPRSAESAHTVLLPGIGSYMWMANQNGDTQALMYAVFAMFCVIVFYDQCIFRPLLHVVRNYQAQEDDSVHARSWVITLVYRTRWFRAFLGKIRWAVAMLIAMSARYTRRAPSPESAFVYYNKPWSWFTHVILIGIAGYLLVQVVHMVTENANPSELLTMIYLGACTFSRVFALIILCLIVWVPIGVWVGFRSDLADRSLPIIQFLAAFPPNIFYPLLMEIIIVYKLNVDVWCAPLMILGTQWYILFNVIAAVRAIPKEMIHAVNNMGVQGWLRWRRFILPAIAPHLVTGAMAASGGAWNASIAAEVLSWHGQVVRATGLGAYIADAHAHGTVNSHVWAILVMSLYVVIINRLFWYPLYRYTEKHFAQM
ncbi:MAG: ABC transporter permease subunit [Pseudomonadota bacterium]|nr:ABC transporter permease subunit [Pseudomonadota bacterium]